ncbi:hypothetical protein [Polynucleobacter sphagniphilus]|jgi:hypothetical protein|uniref:Uncharacterized protein n=1 Tax=Polynucleobacter sphagniphilus TaxID=1743169 RepID=A0AA43MBF6_9BURK|nr:hypothetical protein [Polynucleobacter sphagniphilus]MDH6504814.1 hypothetical protein [Polynucleobacter sphagniphilus]MDH6512916.1 hypothetical protein [Polynucleobacter sphagniphilus]
MSRNGHIHLGCELGCIAMITDSKFSVNRGLIVKVIEPMGLMRWPGFDTEVMPIWRVQVLAQGHTICYHLPKKGELRHEKVGLVPDQFLQCLTPLSGQMRFEFEDYEPEPNLEPMAL